MKTTEELRKLDIEKLLKELSEAEDSLFKVKFGVANKQAANSHEVKQRRHYVARIKTIVAEMRNSNQTPAKVKEEKEVVKED